MGLFAWIAVVNLSWNPADERGECVTSHLVICEQGRTLSDSPSNDRINSLDELFEHQRRNTVDIYGLVCAKSRRAGQFS